MSCHVVRKLSNVKISFWGGAAFLLSLSDGAAIPNSFWVALISPILLWLILLLWSGASFQLLAFGRCCFSSSSFRVVLSSSHPSRVVVRCPPPSGWCCFPASFWVVVIFSFIECFWTEFTEIRSINWSKRHKRRREGGREGGREGQQPPEMAEGKAAPPCENCEHHPTETEGENSTTFEKTDGISIPMVTVGRRRLLLTTVSIVTIVDRLHLLHRLLLGRSHRPAAPNQRRSEENSTTHTVREEEQHHSN